MTGILSQSIASHCGSAVSKDYVLSNKREHGTKLDSTLFCNTILPDGSLGNDGCDYFELWQRGSFRFS